MARKKGSSIADFENVATPPGSSINTNDNNNVNNNDKDNINDDNKDANISINDDINTILEANKKNEKILVGIYFEKEVAKQLDKLSKKGGRGTKSKLVNAAVKKILQEQNMM